MKRKSGGRKIGSGEGAMGLATWQASLISDIYHPTKNREGVTQVSGKSFAELPKKHGLHRQEWGGPGSKTIPGKAARGMRVW